MVVRGERQRHPTAAASCQMDRCAGPHGDCGDSFVRAPDINLIQDRLKLGGFAHMSCQTASGRPAPGEPVPLDRSLIGVTSIS